MKQKWIHSEIVIDEDTIETLATNDKTLDLFVVLRRADRVDGGGVEHWIDTSTGPRVITLDETSWSCSIAQAAEALGCDAYELQAQMEEHLYPETPESEEDV